jgi:hypothetical protein
MLGLASLTLRENWRVLQQPNFIHSGSITLTGECLHCL